MESMDFTKMVESFRWTGDKSWKREHVNVGFSTIADSYNQEQTPAHHSSEKVVSKDSSQPDSPGHSSPDVVPSSKAKRRLVLASNGEIQLRTSDGVEVIACTSAVGKSLCSLGAETTNRMETGGMVDKSQSRLERVLASDWYKPGQKLHDKRKTKNRKICSSQQILSSKNDNIENGAMVEKARARLEKASASDWYNPGQKSNAKKKIQCKKNCSSKKENMEKGGMLERALTRLERTSDLDWYKPGPKLCLKQKSKENVQGDSKMMFSSKKTSKRSTRAAERESKIEFSEHFARQKIRFGEQKQLCSIQQLPGADNLVIEYNTSSGIAGQSRREKSMQSQTTDDKSGRDSADKFNVSRTGCNPERYNENFEERNGRNLVLNKTADGLDTCGNVCKALDDETRTLDISPFVTNGQQGKKRRQKRAGKSRIHMSYFHEASLNANCLTDDLKPRRKMGQVEKRDREFVCEDLLNRSWSSDDGSVAGLPDKKRTRDRTNKIAHSKNLVRQRVENPSYVSDLCEDAMVVDWSSGTTSSYAYKTGRQQRVTKTSHVRGAFDRSMLCQLNNEVSSKERKRQRVGNITCKDTTAVADEPLKKKRQQRIDKRNNVKDNVGANVSDEVLHLVWTSDTSPPMAHLPQQEKKRGKRQELARNSKAGTTKHKHAATISSLSDISSVPETIVTRKKQVPDPNALGLRIIANKDWVPPVSVHALIQEELFKDPWKVLVVCMLLNRTSGTQTRQVIWNLFDLCPSPEAAVAVETAKIEEIIQSLGLQHKRARMIQRLSQEYLSKDWSNVTELHGIGKYATDAYAIFCEGRWREVQPKDHKLNDYWQYLHATDGLGYAFKDDR